MFDDEGSRQKQLVGACLDDAEVLQQVLVGNAFLRTQHLIDGRTVTAGLSEQRVDACNTGQLVPFNFIS